MLSCATSSSSLSVCVLFEVHRANTMYCSFTNQMLQVPFLLLQHRELSLHLSVILIKLAAISAFFCLSLKSTDSCLYKPVLSLSLALFLVLLTLGCIHVQEVDDVIITDEGKGLTRVNDACIWQKSPNRKSTNNEHD